MKLNKFIVLTTVLLLTSCVPPIVLPKPEISVREDTFNESIIVTSDTAGGFCHSVSFHFGYEWNSKHPNDVVILLKSGDLRNFYDFDVKIDGKVYRYDFGKTYRDIGTYNELLGQYLSNSQARVVIPLEILRKMTTAEKVFVRVNQSNGYEDCVYSREEEAAPDLPEGKVLYTKRHAIDFLRELDTKHIK